MEHDKENGLMSFDKADTALLRIPSVLPVEEAEVAIQALERARSRTNAIDPSEFPGGAHRNALLVQHTKDTARANQLERQLASVATISIVSGFEELLS